MTNKLFSINEFIEVKDENYDEFYEKFINFIENNGWSFIGLTNEADDEE